MTADKWQDGLMQQSSGLALLSLSCWLALAPFSVGANVSAEMPANNNEQSNWQFGYRGSAEAYRSADSLWFENVNRWQHQLLLDGEYQQDGGRLHLVGRKRWLDDAEGASGQADQLILAEMYLDTSLADWELTVGKKRLNWGVGYAQQPLNLITTEAKMATGVEVEEGAWLVSAERYTESGAWTLLLASSKTQQPRDEAQPSSAGVRYYQLVDGWDLQALAFTDDVHHLQIGGSAVGVIGEQTTVHLTGLWQQQYQRWSVADLASWPDGFTAETVAAREHQSDGWHWLTGAFVSFASGLSVLAEYWYDNRTLSRNQWQDQFDAANQFKHHADHSDVAMLLQSGQLMFTGQNLLAHNLMLYLSYEQPQWQAKMDVQLTPQDGGYVLTSRLLWPTPDGAQLEVGNRFYGGPATAVYQQVPNQQEWFLRFAGRF